MYAVIGKNIIRKLNSIGKEIRLDNYISNEKIYDIFFKWNGFNFLIFGINLCYGGTVHRNVYELNEKKDWLNGVMCLQGF